MRRRLYPAIDIGELTNGLQVVTAALPHLHTTSLAVFVKVGSRFESADSNGISHFVEHMLFRGTHTYPGSRELMFAIENLGSSLHAETGRDLSLFYMNVEPAMLDRALALFGEIFCQPRFADIDIERNIILEEFNEDYGKDDTEINGEDIACGLLFGQHPLGQRIIGTRKNISSFGEDDIREHFARHYTGANMVLCAAGPVDADEVRVAAQAHLGQLPRGEVVSTIPFIADDGPARRRAQYKYVRDDSSQTSIHVAFRSVADMDPQYMASVALLRAIDDGMSTPLHYELCDRRGLAYSVQADIVPLADVALFEASGATSQGNLVELLDGVLTLLAGFRNTLVGDEELDKIKRRYRHDLLNSLDDSYALAGWLGGTRLYYPPPSFAERKQQMEAVSADDIRTVARRIFKPENMAVAIVGPLSRSRRIRARELVVGWR